MEEKYQNFLSTEFTVFDIETSGLDPARDEILEIAALRLKGREEVGRFEALIQPSKAIVAEVEKIHGLNELYLLVNGRKSEEVLADFLRFVAGSIVVGHNIKEFDWLFVASHAQRHAQPLPPVKMIDTLELARKTLSLPSYNLAAVARNFGWEHLNAHRAMPDVEINAKVFLAIMEKVFSADQSSQTV